MLPSLTPVTATTGNVDVTDPFYVMLDQNKVPKVDVETMEPASWPANPSKEWCPPGHGDLYAALSGSGKLDEVSYRRL